MLIDFVIWYLANINFVFHVVTNCLLMLKSSVVHFVELKVGNIDKVILEIICYLVSVLLVRSTII
jgi:hypothetical protein